MPHQIGVGGNEIEHRISNDVGEVDWNRGLADRRSLGHYEVAMTQSLKDHDRKRREAVPGALQLKLSEILDAVDYLVISL